MDLHAAVSLRVEMEKYGIVRRVSARCSPFFFRERCVDSFLDSLPQGSRARPEAILHDGLSLRERNVGVTARFERERMHRRSDLAEGGHLCTCGQGPGNSAAICRSATASIRARTGATSSGERACACARLNSVEKPLTLSSRYSTFVDIHNARI